METKLSDSLFFFFYNSMETSSWERDIASFTLIESSLETHFPIPPTYNLPFCNYRRPALNEVPVFDMLKIVDLKWYSVNIIVNSCI